MSAFIFNLPTKIIFGQPTIDALQTELAALSATRTLLVSDPGLEKLEQQLHLHQWLCLLMQQLHQAPHNT